MAARSKKVAKKVRTKKLAPKKVAARRPPKAAAKPKAKRASATKVIPFTAEELLPPALRAPPAAPRVLSIDRVERLLSIAMKRGGDFAEVYAERTVLTSLTLDEGRIKSANVSETAGVGIRVVQGAQVGYAYSDDLDDAALARAAETASLIANGDRAAAPVKVSRRHAPEHFRVTLAPADVAVDAKASLLLRADKTARAADRRIAQVMGGWADQAKTVLVANTLGHLAEDRQDLCRFSVSVIALDPKTGERRTGSYGGGGRVPFTHFDTFTPEKVAREAARQAIAMFGASEAPAGSHTVVLAPGWSGILLHEAVGHGLEADFIRKGTSLFAGKVGEKVASDLVTVIDDGTVAGARGSLNVDDEGNAAQRKVLIEKGVLKGFLYDAVNARLMGKDSTGSGRRESFRAPPMPRMTNTFLAPGDHAPDEILKSVKKGIYAANFGGGQVDITNGNFVFEVNEAYLIEDGRLTRPVKGATLIGIGPVALQKVTMVGNDPAHDPGMGTCGKNGQSVPVGVGLPTLRLDDVTVGGTRLG